jgi:succinate dehydrogenase/fumarate reductase flavoprotein subunit
MPASWEELALVEHLATILEEYPNPTSLIKSCAAPTWEAMVPKAVRAFRELRGRLPAVVPMEPRLWNRLPIDDRIEILVNHMLRCIDIIKNLDIGNCNMKHSLLKTSFFYIQFMEDQRRRADLNKILHTIAGPATDVDGRKNSTMEYCRRSRI